ncbi:hypothetical protein ACGFYP_16190 [Streptomyces sp. NPDC048370]|uniref:hypothetical protein n=1 Tax=Streptomyces sp. NPDC048370 TaxID=3365540 RepID=UPI00371F9DFC
MGIESDQLVFDYLSRVGDLAQQRQLPSGDRMRLVSTLRGEIDRRRATFGQESPAAIRGILDALGSPDEVVDRAAGGDGDGAGRAGEDGRGGGRGSAQAPELPVQRGGRLLKGKRAVPKPRTARIPRALRKPTVEAPGPTPPHLAGMDEIGSADTDPDWWRLDDLDVDEPLPGDDLVPGFRGGVEIPELLKPPPRERDEENDLAEEVEEAAARRPLWRRVLRVGRPSAESEGGGFRLGSPVLVLAAVLLLGGVVFGSLVPLALGWLLAYGSRRLSRAETQWAVVIIPGLAAAGGATWLWGRVQGRWGEPVAQGGEAMGAAVSETWPWTLKAAAIATAVFLLWRARRAAASS